VDAEQSATPGGYEPRPVLERLDVAALGLFGMKNFQNFDRFGKEI
jgi:hypothetical protein